MVFVHEMNASISYSFDPLCAIRRCWRRAKKPRKTWKRKGASCSASWETRWCKWKSWLPPTNTSKPASTKSEPSKAICKPSSISPFDGMLGGILVIKHRLVRPLVRKRRSVLSTHACTWWKLARSKDDCRLFLSLLSCHNHEIITHLIEDIHTVGLLLIGLCQFALIIHGLNYMVFAVSVFFSTTPVTLSFALMIIICSGEGVTPT